MAKHRTELTKRQRYWLNHIKAADASEGTLVAYAAAHDLKVKDLYQWKTTLSRRGLLPVKAAKRAFVPVATSPAAPAASCSISLPNGVRLQFTGEVDAASVSQILATAHALS